MKTQRNGISSTWGMLIILGILALFLIVFSIGFEKRLAGERRSPNIQIVSCIGNPILNVTGGITFKVFDHWGYGEIGFICEGFTGTPNKISVAGHLIEPNTTNEWNLWLERYEQVRKEATTGKRP